jgi:hypothetical protein
VAALLVRGALEVVVPDAGVADRLLADAGLHLGTAATAKIAGDLAGAYQLAYDALRKSAAALLAVQGLRSTSRGGHVAVQEAVLAQFGDIKALKAFNRMRRARNRLEYPDATTIAPSLDELDDAIASAGAVHAAALSLISSGRVSAWVG